MDLLQAELYYLDKHLIMAELSYQASIASARNHNFYHEKGWPVTSMESNLLRTNRLQKV